jgi:hypothetical protein
MTSFERRCLHSSHYYYYSSSFRVPPPAKTRFLAVSNYSNINSIDASKLVVAVFPAFCPCVVVLSAVSTIVPAHLGFREVMTGRILSSLFLHRVTQMYGGVLPILHEDRSASMAPGFF